MTDIIKNEPDYIKKIMNKFDNSPLIYYKLKSFLVNIPEKENNEYLQNFVNFICKEIQDEIKLFYSITNNNNTNNIIFFGKNNVKKLFRFIQLCKTQIFFDFNQFSDYIEEFPFKYIKTKYYRVNISHPEFLELFPKYFRNQIDKYKNANLKDSLICFNNDNCPLSDKIENYLEKLNAYLDNFKGVDQKYISFFSIEPLYKILENCCKELLIFSEYQYQIILELYEENNRGFKGDLFEWISYK